MEQDLYDDFSVTLAIDGVLDLHQFSPKDVKTLVPDYLELCLEKDILEVRIMIFPHSGGHSVKPHFSSFPIPPHMRREICIQS